MRMRRKWHAPPGYGRTRNPLRNMPPRFSFAPLAIPSGLSAPALCESYILPGVFQLGPEDVFLDCGAYDGDTIRNLIDNQHSIRKD